MAIAFNVQEIVTAMNGEVAVEVREIGFRVLSTVVLGTPVGDPRLWKNPDSAPPGYVGGHARRNWQVGISRSPSTELPGTDGGGGATIGAGVNQIAGYKLRSGRVYIVNNVPYINRLNNGWSEQAPVGFVEQAITAGVRGAQGRKNI